MANFTNTDKFGNAYKIVKLKKNKNGFPTGYVEIGNSLYKLDVSPAKKEGVELWLKLTKLNKKSSSWSNYSSF